ncbi:hypothetical protein RDV64_02665 [Acuticoccus sp. MNP-M23]|nr:hypothetical protein [Acuticoccus sp. MNP-M23]WMS43324.1 hypothetical protein RDV64_02665 [Acuticoccus sp. MNP-M23]
MTVEASLGIAAGTFILALGGALWFFAGDAVFTAITAFGQLICA